MWKAGTAVYRGSIRRYLILISKSPDFHPRLRHIATTLSRDFATTVSRERVGMCKTIQERI